MDLSTALRQAITDMELNLKPRLMSSDRSVVFGPRFQFMLLLCAVEAQRIRGELQSNILQSKILARLMSEACENLQDMQHQIVAAEKDMQMRMVSKISMQSMKENVELLVHLSHRLEESHGTMKDISSRMPNEQGK